MNNPMIELAYLIGIQHDNLPREVLAERVCEGALEQIKQLQDQQCVNAKLASKLFEINQFCQLMGIGTIGDSAKDSLIQSYKEVAAQAQRLRECAILSQDHDWCSGFDRVIDDDGNTFFDHDEAQKLWDMARSETPPAAIESLKSKWQNDQYDDGMPAQKAFWEGFERGAIVGPANIRKHWEEWKYFKIAQDKNQ